MKVNQMTIQILLSQHQKSEEFVIVTKEGLASIYEQSFTIRRFVVRTNKIKD
jgi:hypothetical protein